MYVTVELHVQASDLVEGVGIVSSQLMLHSLTHGAQEGEVCDSELCGSTRGLPLEKDPHVVARFNVSATEPNDLSASPGNEIDESICMQALERLSNWRAAHTELCRHGPLAEPGPSRDVAAEDFVPKNVVDRT